MCPALARSLACLAALPALASVATAQGDAGEAGGADRAWREARRALARFESTRLWSLPEGHGAPDRCSHRVGRFCYWYDGTDGPEEPPRVVRARRRLLARLEASAREAPEHPVLLGQRVRYWVEAGFPDSAALVVAACDGGDWWCLALRGYALQEAGDGAAAEASFDAALSAMPEEARCRWNDVAYLLPKERARRYRALPCAERAELERRLWWLADPFWSRPANDRRVEHLARMTLAEVLRSGRSPHGLSWDDDVLELGVRFGWPHRWSRGRRSTQELRPTVIGHEPSPSFGFLPAPELLDDPFQAGAEDWDPMSPEAHARYAPRWARAFLRLPTQVAVLRRGDSLLVLAARRLPPVLTDSGALALAASDSEPPLVVRSPTIAAAHVYAAVVPDAPHLASVESLTDSARAWRTRLAVQPPPHTGDVGTSELVLFAPAFGPADTVAAPTLDAVLPAMLGDATVHAPGQLGVYWELYGLPEGRQRVGVTLAVTGEEPGWLRRLGERLRRLPPRAPVHMQWEDVPTVRGDVTSRAVVVELPALPPGRYDVTLQLRVRGNAPLEVTRAIHVARQ